MFADLAHFTQLACTDWVNPTGGAADYTKFDGQGNVFCGFTKSSVTNIARSAKDAEWPAFTGTTTITVRFCLRFCSLLYCFYHRF